MKRKSEDADSFGSQAKKARLDKVVPLEGSVSLLQLAVLHRVLGNYCIGVSGGLAVPETMCEICTRKPVRQDAGCGDAIDRYVSRGTTLPEQDKYKVYVLMREVSKRGQVARLSLSETPDEVSISFHDLRHLSWFAIQVMLFDSPVFSVDCDLTSQAMKVVCKSHSDAHLSSPKDDTLREIALRYQRSVVRHLARSEPY